MTSNNSSREVIRNVVKDSDQVVSQSMSAAISEWMDLYKGLAPWLTKNTKTLKLPSTISAEVARLVTLESVIKITGSKRADFLAKSITPFLDGLRTSTEYACAGGATVLKPYYDGKKLSVETIQHDSFYPLEFDTDDVMTSAAFPEFKEVGEYIYMRIEKHAWDGKNYVVTNEVYKSLKTVEKFEPATLGEVKEWENLKEETPLKNLTGTLFSYFKIPLGNTVDPSSPLGVSVYSRGVSLIEDADKQYQRMLWEFEGGELAIDASKDMFTMERGAPVLPEGKERLFRTNDIDATTVKGDNLMTPWSPTLRDTSFINGLNQILVALEDVCCLSRGTISLNTVDARTATEIRSTKQRTYSMVSEIQKSLQAAIEKLVYAMDVYVTIYKLAPAGKYELTFEWDDSVINDPDIDKSADKEDVRDGLMAKWEYRMKWYNEDEKTARKMMQEIKDDEPVVDEDTLIGFAKDAEDAKANLAKGAEGDDIVDDAKAVDKIPPEDKQKR